MTRDALVIGGGIAGSTAAILLARAGRNVTLIEREAKPTHKVCGEFLSTEALTSLQTLGINPTHLGAVPITHVRLARNQQTTEATLPFAAMSLTRRTLDEALLQAAANAGATILRGRNVEALEHSNANEWIAHLSHTSEPITASTAFLATGKHDLRSWPRPAGVQPDLVAFKMYWRLTPAQTRALANHVELHLFRHGYAGLQPVEDGSANLCCVVRKAHLRTLGGQWQHLLTAMQSDCALLRERLTNAHPLLERPLAVAAIPYGFVQSQSNGAWTLGDQAAVIPSFTGDGMSMALHSAITAARMYLEGQTPSAFQTSLQTTVRAQVRFATLLSRAMVSPLTQPLIFTAARLWPTAMQTIAQRTRLPLAANLS